jgi:hypothetical protein
MRHSQDSARVRRRHRYGAEDRGGKWPFRRKRGRVKRRRRTFRGRTQEPAAYGQGSIKTRSRTRATHNDPNNGVNTGFEVRKMTTAHPQTSATVAEFLQHTLANGARDVIDLEAMARKAGLLGTHRQIQHAKAFKNAKRSLGIRSTRDGFGSAGKWAWLLPAKSIKPAKNEADRTNDATTCEQARSVVVNLNGLPAELLSGRIPPHWVYGIARLESHKAPRDVPAHRWRQFINDCHTFLMAKENWAERVTGRG